MNQLKIYRGPLCMSFLPCRNRFGSVKMNIAGLSPRRCCHLLCTLRFTDKNLLNSASATRISAKDLTSGHVCTIYDRFHSSNRSLSVKAQQTKEKTEQSSLEPSLAPDKTKSLIGNTKSPSLLSLLDEIDVKSDNVEDTYYKKKNQIPRTSLLELLDCDDGKIELPVSSNVSTSAPKEDRERLLESTGWEHLIQSIERGRQLSRDQLHSLLEAYDSSQAHDMESIKQNLVSYQVWLECQSHQESVLKYETLISNAKQKKNYSSLPNVQRQLLQWYEPLRDAIAQAQSTYFNGGTRLPYGPHMSLLQPEKLAVITTHETVIATLTRGGSAPLGPLALQLGEAIEAEVNVQKLIAQKYKTIKDPIQDQIQHVLEETKENGNECAEKISPMYRESNLLKFIEDSTRSDPNATKKQRLQVRTANKRAKKLLKSDEEWLVQDKVHLGAALIKLLLETATLDKSFYKSNADSRAFVHEIKWISNLKSVGYVTLNQELFQRIVDEKLTTIATQATRFQPMIVPPKPWQGPSSGAYYALPASLMRTRGCKPQQHALELSNLDQVYDALDALGSLPWKINSAILEVANRCWEEGVVLGDIPSRVDFKLPSQPTKPLLPNDFDFENKESDEYKEHMRRLKEYNMAMYRYRKVSQKNMDLYSLRCSAMLKLNQAEKFKNFSSIYFPYNLDFRGRAYPIPPHLSNIGSDLCRGLLKFSKSKALGLRGLYWLKVHLANLAGADKLTFDGRVAFTESNMNNIRAAVSDPLGENRWWMTCDDPFQALATCHEIVNALDSGDPATYMCSLPVHMDGSCNGLQHYAALGRDYVGGRAVNLCVCEEPQDVYIGVMHKVIERVAEEAAKECPFENKPEETLTAKEKKMLKDNKAAKLVNGHIDRGVVKRTVMTSVYGVTFIGARKQIQEKIVEKLEEAGVDADIMEKEINYASSYVARVTMDVMGELFQGARLTMNWLADCARLIASRGQPVAWFSPVGVPVVQPYRQSKSYTIVTILQNLVLSSSDDYLPIHKQRQVTAFPPNYVHSLDSSHMLLTALEMRKRGLEFSAVHDSFWTHPSDVDEMNIVLREVFTDLYEGPLLEELKRNWELRYPDLIFPALPEKGTLNLEEVKHAPYFFQ